MYRAPEYKCRLHSIIRYIDNDIWIVDIDVDICILHLCNCLYPPILISLISCVHACILASLHPHILKFMYSRYLLVSLHPHILISLGLRMLSCNLVSSHPLVLTFMYSVCLLLSAHPYILISLGSCTLGACWYPRILTSSYP